MTASLTLRLASAIALLQWVAHTALFLRSTPRHGAEEVAVIDAMRSHRFAFAGASRSYWDFYFGYGLMAAFVVLVEAVLFWQLAGGVAASRSLVRAVATLFLLYNVGHALLAARYFFITPIIPDVLLAALLGVAVVQLRG